MVFAYCRLKSLFPAGYPIGASAKRGFSAFRVELRKDFLGFLCFLKYFVQIFYKAFNIIERPFKKDKVGHSYMVALNNVAHC